MKNTVGVFTSREDAERAGEHLRAIGIPKDRIDILTPGQIEESLDGVATAETEQPGIGKAVGGTVGGAVGAAGGLSLGAAAASLLVPGVGPVIAGGLLGAAVLGATGAISGAAAGGALDESLLEGIPIDELYVYEDALRQGRSVLIVMTKDTIEEDQAREILAREGAESLDAAREGWWVGLRDAEQEHYTATGGDFTRDEQNYRRGFEAALHPSARGKSFDSAHELLRARYPDSLGTEAFRRGYERGQAYLRSRSERPQPSRL